MINKVLIANRGEIAVRIIRACKEMGIKTVAIFSTADKDALHVNLADESVCVGGPKAKDSYLNMSNILSAASSTKCDAIHPGFGFLSESSKFARLCIKCNLIWIGPNPDVIDKMGNKSEAKKTMIKAKVPIVPGSKGEVSSVSEGLKIASQIGYPVLIKASSGGGGKGMRVANSEAEFEDAFFTAKTEALNNFGDDGVYIEKFLNNPKHVEVQVVGDKFGNIIHLFERDCSIQRRKQKMIEEAPCFFLRQDVKERLYEDAIKASRAVKYDSVGTIEFVVDEDQNYYFIEMNTRIQVEHPITEMITNVDIVKTQIRIAAGQKLQYKQEDIHQNGYALECRINAEDITRDFAPNPGKITFMNLPGGKGVRIDTATYVGYTIPPFYDSMILKVITFAPTRFECIRKMRVALEELIIDGVKTNIDYQYVILHSPQFIQGNYNTGFIELFQKEIATHDKLISRTQK
ncbi:MAG: acetyl-CoA carboxylase biotin carboxylase subunit [Anaeroplasmataceae bacterium]